MYVQPLPEYYHSIYNKYRSIYYRYISMGFITNIRYTHTAGIYVKPQKGSEIQQIAANSI